MAPPCRGVRLATLAVALSSPGSSVGLSEPATPKRTRQDESRVAKGDRPLAGEERDAHGLSSFCTNPRPSVHSERRSHRV